jgi:hypothetical protein
MAVSAPSILSMAVLRATGANSLPPAAVALLTADLAKAISVLGGLAAQALTSRTSAKLRPSLAILGEIMLGSFVFMGVYPLC